MLFDPKRAVVKYCGGDFLSMVSCGFDNISYTNLNFRKTASTTTAKKAPGGGSSAAGMWRFYTEDSPGIKV